MTSHNDQVTAAIQATKEFVSVLMREELHGWVNRFEAIAKELQNGDVKEAIKQFEACSYTGPGSLSDVFAKDDKAFYAGWGSCSKALRALRHTK